eukprot:m.996486 g.996486  ORF g.996486 m.996486 type:complete len:93 (+) comp24019_c0_seq42:2106-2384(+)
MVTYSVYQQRQMTTGWRWFDITTAHMNTHEDIPQLLPVPWDKLCRFVLPPRGMSAHTQPPASTPNPPWLAPCHECHCGGLAVLKGERFQPRQ